MAQQKTESKNQNKRNNETVKHVQLERKRPKLSKVNGSKQGNNKSNNQNKKNNNRRPKQNQTKRDPKATLRIIPLGRARCDRQEHDGLRMQERHGARRCGSHVPR